MRVSLFLSIVQMSFVVLAKDGSSLSLDVIENALLEEVKLGESNRLFLTPFINTGKVNTARRMARVKNWTDVESYSGYFTVNSKYNSNLFFWFFPAMTYPDTAPVLIWLQGGPGGSSMFGLFVENGPFYINENLELNRRNISWTSQYSVIFIDNPVGSGFSFTEDDKGYATTTGQASDSLYEAVRQFFQLFPTYRRRDLFLTGESYGAKWVLGLATKIHLENQQSQQLINLKGMAIGDGYFDPINVFNWGSLFYDFGLIDEIERTHFHTEERKTRDLIRLMKWRDSYETVNTLLLDSDGTNKSYFTNVTGYLYLYNALITETPNQEVYYMKFLDSSSVQKSIHAYLRTPFVTANIKVVNYLVGDYTKSSAPLLVELLDAPQNYKILLYNGNLDPLVPSISIERTLRKLGWKWKTSYLNSKKLIWKVGDEIVGYVKTFKNLSFVVVRNAGHLVPKDQPKVALDMINRLTSNTPFA